MVLFDRLNQSTISISFTVELVTPGEFFISWGVYTQSSNQRIFSPEIPSDVSPSTIHPMSISQTKGTIIAPQIEFIEQTLAS